MLNNKIPLHFLPSLVVHICEFCSSNIQAGNIIPGFDGMGGSGVLIALQELLL